MANNFHVAIVGGGLCGLALAVALRTRSVPFTIYELRSSFTELGAGINIGPNALAAFNLIDKDLGEAVYGLCTRNLPGKEDVWFQVRLGAPSGKHEDAELIAELMSPPTGNMTLSRNELLQKLAEKAGLGKARFNKKLVGLDEDEDGVVLRFADGTQDRASVVIACDGIHSSARRIVLGPDHPAAKAVYTEAVVYRGVLPMDRLSAAVGYESAHMSTFYLHSNGYVILYPIDGGRQVSTGFWVWQKGAWQHNEWMLPKQSKEFHNAFRDWGDTVHKIMDLMSDPPVFATHYHGVQPDSMSKGRVCLIGDAAHSMPPHQGQGGAQAMEDAYVIGELLANIAQQQTSREQIDAAFEAYEKVRVERANQVKDTSVDAFDFWTGFWDDNVSDEQIRQFLKAQDKRFHWIWNDDIAAQAERAIQIMQDSLAK
ncbi:FAD/NAD(P)-binding domain-containing protein [Teratosphaeria nubilosa]|uniref:FAD/NAD(P)-binding domain-containing protein n=1 Tax=Teratosphaeria nubilosa TaxID=161662 RepID=A0A6G1L7M0_9PEZI|nr:FAD/NAD(P)-binding domain-containing protein [Teratosphaeria nubilosa]